jgi:hypothetical protein
VQTSTKVIIGIVAYHYLNAVYVGRMLRDLGEENERLRERSKNLTKLVNSMAKHTECTVEEQQLAIDINFHAMTKDLDIKE